MHSFSAFLGWHQLSHMDRVESQAKVKPYLNESLAMFWLFPLKFFGNFWNYTIQKEKNTFQIPRKGAESQAASKYCVVKHILDELSSDNKSYLMEISYIVIEVI